MIILLIGYFLATIIVQAASFEILEDGQQLLNITQYPSSIQHNSSIVIKYSCRERDDVVGVELYVSTQLYSKRVVWRQSWHCHNHQLGVSLFRTLLIKLPTKLRFSPSHWNPVSVTADTVHLQAFMIKAEGYITYLKKSSETFNNYPVIISLRNVSLDSPYARPQRPLTQCFVPYGTLQAYRPMCAMENDVVTAVQYPLLLAGGSMGVSRIFKQFKSKQKQKLHKAIEPKFTISLWLYVIEFCPDERTACSVMHRLSWDDYFYTPSVYINKLGNLRIVLVTPDGRTLNYNPTFIVPKKQWFRLVFGYKEQMMSITINHGKEFQEIYTLNERVLRADVPYYNDVKHLHVFGGSEMGFTFKGIIGEAVVYRGKYVTSESIQMPSSDHQMFNLGLKQIQESCNLYRKWGEYIDHKRLRINWKNFKKNQIASCQSIAAKWQRYQWVSGRRQCEPFEGPPPSGTKQIIHQIHSWKLILQSNTSRFYTSQSIAEDIYLEVQRKLEDDGLENTFPGSIEMLKMSSCLGNHDATYMLYTVLDQGITMKSSKQKALQHLFSCVLDGHRLCQMALGHKFVYGLDGFPHDLEQAYAYYQPVAERTHGDYDSASEKQVAASKVRLTDPFTVEDHTEIDGDLIQWYKMWAAKGDLFAMKELASIFYWGRMGIPRDMAVAAEYYRLAALTEDAAALYDYGIVLLKGHGVKNDTAAALRHLQKAADKRWTPAMNTLGWHSMNILQDYGKALEYFQEASNYGNSDAHFNIGYMYLHGKLPSRKPQKYEAFEYFALGAKAHQKLAGVYVAMYNMRGHPACGRSVNRALMWAQDIAELNPSVTLALTNGVLSYRKKNFGTSLLYYNMAALTGTELGNFNLAYICEEHQSEIQHLMEDECVWTNYNFSVLRADHKVNSFSLNKMGDFYFNGYIRGQKNFSMAAKMYGKAAYKGDPQALFNLALLVEEDISNPALHNIWMHMKIAEEYWSDNITLQLNLFARCQEANDADGYVACSISYYKVMCLYMWKNYSSYIQFLLVGFCCLVGYQLFRLWLTWRSQEIRRLLV